jgi:hypothetical protein
LTSPTICDMVVLCDWFFNFIIGVCYEIKTN